MATMAHPVSSLEVTAPSDAMEIHSDNGHDFDIDLGDEPETATHHEDDDDLSLHDAQLDEELDLQTTFPDHDDLMADKDDFNEDVDIDYLDVEVVDANAGPLSHNSPAVPQEATVDDDDLIDYSDEEDEQPQSAQDNAPHLHVAPEQQEAIVDAIDMQNPEHAQSEAFQTANEPHESDYKEEEIDYGQEADQTADENWDNAPDSGWEQHANDEHGVDTVLRNEEHEHQEVSELHTDEEEDPLLRVDESAETAANVQPDQSTDAEHDSEIDNALRSHQVTVNYDGSEYWLFQPEDSASEDEWLLPESDLKYAKDNLLFLFGACRTALGDEIGSDIEMGLRFDYLHNLELFEDSTACMQTSLGELVYLYLKLHAQDGNTSPDSFYMTLRFRPRVSALLGELEKAVQESTGYIGFNTAVAAGQTVFNTPLSNEYTDDEHEHWEEEQKSEHDDGHVKQEGNQEEVEVFANSENEQDKRRSENNSPAHVAGQVESQSNEAVDATLDKSAEEDRDAQEERTASPPKYVHTPATTFSVEGEGDIIDYSDDEDEAPTQIAQPDLVPARNPSSGSSTVQGDSESLAGVNAQESTNPTESKKDGEQYVCDDEGLENTENGENSYTGLDADYSNYEETAGTDPSAYDNDAFNEEFDHGYDQNAADQGYECEEYPVQDANDGDTSYYYEEAGTNQQDDPEFLGTAQDEADFGVPDQVVGDDTYADLDDSYEVTTGDAATGSGIPALEEIIYDPVEEGTNYVIDNDYIDYDDDVGGTVEQLTVATSAAAQPVAASSNGLDHEGMPQGQKRSIDEVGNGLDNGTDLSDAKRPRV